MEIGFIGLGKLGLPCAEVIAQRGHNVAGYDVVPFSSSLVTSTQSVKECVSGKEIVFVAVPTPHDPDYDGRNPTSQLAPKDFYYDTVKEVLQEANQHMNTRQLLVLISTVMPGTVREQLVELTSNTRLVYNPYLIAMGTVSWDMINPEMVIIGTEDGEESGPVRRLVGFYETIMENNPRYEIGTWDEAECIKVFYNTFISAKIGIVNMIQDVAHRQGNINVDVVTDALANSDMRITGPQYMKAGMGDGGGCHPRDNIALRHMSERLDLEYDLFGSIMHAREIQAKNLAKELVRHATSTGFPIYIHGKSYKPGVPYVDGSYSLLVGHYCAELGCDPTYIDPLTGDMDCPVSASVFLLAHSASTTYKHTGRPQQDKLYCKIPANSIVVDPWRSFTSIDSTVIHYGNTRNA